MVICIFSVQWIERMVADEVQRLLWEIFLGDVVKISGKEKIMGQKINLYGKILLVVSPSHVHVVESTVGIIDAILGLIRRNISVGVVDEIFGEDDLIRPIATHREGVPHHCKLLFTVDGEHFS